MQLNFVPGIKLHRFCQVTLLIGVNSLIQYTENQVPETLFLPCFLCYSYPLPADHHPVDQVRSERIWKVCKGGHRFRQDKAGLFPG